MGKLHEMCVYASMRHLKRLAGARRRPGTGTGTAVPLKMEQPSQAGQDALLFNGANVSERIDISANGGRVRFTRDVANITMDLNGVEAVDFNAKGGADNPDQSRPGRHARHRHRRRRGRHGHRQRHQRQ